MIRNAAKNKRIRTYIHARHLVSSGSYSMLVVKKKVFTEVVVVYIYPYSFICHLSHISHLSYQHLIPSTTPKVLSLHYLHSPLPQDRGRNWGIPAIFRIRAAFQNKSFCFCFLPYSRVSSFSSSPLLSLLLLSLSC